MTSFELDIIDEKSQAGSDFMLQAAQALQHAFLTEKSSRKITQQSIADKLGTSRAVINRQLQGLENIGSRRIGELFWAMGWRATLVAQKDVPDANAIPSRSNSTATTSGNGFTVRTAVNDNGSTTVLMLNVPPLRAMAR